MYNNNTLAVYERVSILAKFASLLYFVCRSFSRRIYPDCARAREIRVLHGVVCYLI